MTTRAPSFPSISPPASTPPPPPASQERAGWRPADDDDSAAATAWRARTALRRADRGLTAFSDLKTSVDALTSKIGESEALLTSILRAVRWAIGLIAAAGILGAANWAWHWFSTLHH